MPTNIYYAYVLLDPSGLPFYVGKGTGKRLFDHHLEALRDTPLAKSNPFKCCKIKRIVTSGERLGYRIDRVYGPQAELDCLRREEFLIAHFGRRCDGGVLTNLAAGLGSLSCRDPHSTTRHAATLSGIDPVRPERTALNLFLKALGGVDSVPIKPLSEYRVRLRCAYSSPKNLRTLSRRNGLTIAATVLAKGGQLVPGRPIPRAFDYRPDPEDWPLETPAPRIVRAVIENGAMSDILKLGLADLCPAEDPKDESLVLGPDQIGRVCGILGLSNVREWQLVPDS